MLTKTTKHTNTIPYIKNKNTTNVISYLQGKANMLDLWVWKELLWKRSLQCFPLENGK